MNKPLADSITVSAVCSPNPGLQYKGVDTRSKVTIFRQTFESGTVEIGNFLAIVHCLRLLKRNNIEVSTVYTRSPEAAQWVNNKKCGRFPKNGKKKSGLVEAVKEAEDWLSENNFKAKVRIWEEKDWGNINDVVFGKRKEG